jgi:hypothetical protein
MFGAFPGIQTDIERDKIYTQDKHFENMEQVHYFKKTT